MNHHNKQSEFYLYIRSLRSIGLLIVIFCFYGCDSNGSKQKISQQSTDIEVFDSIIHSVFESNGFLDVQRFQNKLVKENGQRHYVVNYLTPSQNELTHWIVAISVAESGKYIDAAEYDALKNTSQNTSSNMVWKRYLDVDLINTASSFAPKGMFSGMVVTTLDDKYDIRILLSDMLEENATPPSLDHDAVARMILELYAKKS